MDFKKQLEMKLQGQNSTSRNRTASCDELDGGGMSRFRHSNDDSFQSPSGEAPILLSKSSTKEADKTSAVLDNSAALKKAELGKQRARKSRTTSVSGAISDQSNFSHGFCTFSNIEEEPAPSPSPPAQEQKKTKSVFSIGLNNILKKRFRKTSQTKQSETKFYAPSPDENQSSQPKESAEPVKADTKSTSKQPPKVFSKPRKPSLPKFMRKPSRDDSAKVETSNKESSNTERTEESGDHQESDDKSSTTRKISDEQNDEVFEVSENLEKNISEDQNSKINKLHEDKSLVLEKDIDENRETLSLENETCKEKDERVSRSSENEVSLTMRNDDDTEDKADLNEDKEVSSQNSDNEIEEKRNDDSMPSLNHEDNAEISLTDVPKSEQEKSFRLSLEPERELNTDRNPSVILEISPELEKDEAESFKDLTALCHSRSSEHEDSHIGQVPHEEMKTSDFKDNLIDISDSTINDKPIPKISETEEKYDEIKVIDNKISDVKETKVEANCFDDNNVENKRISQEENENKNTDDDIDDLELHLPSIDTIPITKLSKLDSRDYSEEDILEEPSKTNLDYEDNFESKIKTTDNIDSELDKPFNTESTDRSSGSLYPDIGDLMSTKDSQISSNETEAIKNTRSDDPIMTLEEEPKRSSKVSSKPKTDASVELSATSESSVTP